MSVRPLAGASVQLGLAVLRVALLAVVMVGEAAVQHPGPGEGAFAVTAAAAWTWSLAVLALRLAEWRGGVRVSWLSRVEPVIDLLLLACLAYTSGGPHSQVRKAFFVVPFAAAMRTTTAQTAAWGAAAVAAYVGTSVAHPTRAFSESEFPVLLSHCLYLAWAGALAVFLAAVLERRRREMEHLAEARGRLATQALDAEQRERQRLAELLHDEAVQNLLAARQEVTALRRHGRPEALDRLEEALDLTVRQLRGEIFELHPYVLDHAGLAAALRALAERAHERSGAEVTVDVAPDAEGHHDVLVTWLVRELVANAAKHARAQRIAVRVDRAPAELRVEVADDGVGFAEEAAARALSDGHLGLAAARQRVGALGGRLEVRSAPGGGAAVVALLPV